MRFGLSKENIHRDLFVGIRYETYRRNTLVHNVARNTIKRQISRILGKNSFSILLLKYCSVVFFDFNRVKNYTEKNVLPKCILRNYVNVLFDCKCYAENFGYSFASSSLIVLQDKWLVAESEVVIAFTRIQLWNFNDDAKRLIAFMLERDIYVIVKQ